MSQKIMEWIDRLVGIESAITVESEGETGSTESTGQED